MKIIMIFETVPEDLTEAFAELHIEDQREADAPARRLATTRVGPFAISMIHPTITLDVLWTLPPNNGELALMVRVQGHTQDNQPVLFLNTSTTPLPTRSDEPIEVLLSQIV